MSKRFLPLLLMALPVLAGPRYYAAELGQSSWQLSAANPVQCRLEHPIPRYGKAVFEARASRNPNLHFELDMLRLPSRQASARLLSVAPQWQPGAPTRELGRVTLYPHYPAELGDDKAWTLLTELESGRLPTLTYDDWAGQQPVAVALSSGNFRQSYFAFMDCIQGLLPIGFEDIAFSVLRYQKNSSELHPESRRRLALISQYLQHDDSVGQILIDAYSDSYGGRWKNEQLSIQRAQAIKDYLISTGLDEGRIRFEGHGEKRHIASNDTEAGRMQNRRVVIALQR
ncbi:OmpA family protein [Gallaecimonas sp. GXIMD4217]|uniref:flagellar protein MotY n=1 Tax=Gallaecimonas sp. GXIMD4217 TaxID=3131927 RepID=UPI00311B2218